jgi:uncharacterized repeat protein (TIGR01451 family)
MRGRKEAVVVGLAACLAATHAWAVGTPAGTVISSQATATYEDASGNPLTALSNTVTTTVSQVGAVSVAPDNSTGAANPSDVIYYGHIVTNAGNGTDTIDLTASSSLGWAVALFRDVNNNGTYEGGTDVALTDTDSDGTLDSGALTYDATMRILVRVTVPANAADGASDVVTVTGTSSFNTSATDTATDTTTVAAPVLSVAKSVSPTGTQPPGTQLTYMMIVSNGGSGSATNVVLTDPVPTNTTYVASSIQRDSAGRTDAADGDDADFDVTNPGRVTVNIGSLAAGASTTIEFSVTID